MGLQLPKPRQTDTSDTTDLTALRAELDQLRGEKATLLSDRDRERTARVSAERANMSAQERALASEEDASEQKLASLETELQTCEDEIARLADEPGHGKEIAALNRKMAESTANLVREKDRKAYLTGQREKFKKQAEAEPTKTADGGEDEVLANGSKLSSYGPKTQDWLKAHPKVFKDSRYLARAIAAAIEATGAEGIKDQSEEYFDFIDGKLGESRRAAAEEHPESDEGEDGEEIEIAADRRAVETHEPERPQTRAAGPGSMSGPAAPTRNTPNTGGNGGQRKKAALTSEEREVADALYGAIRNPADRYVKYAENKKIMETRETGHFVRPN